MARVKPGFEAATVATPAAKPSRVARRRHTVFERVRVDPSAEWFTDELGNVFSDQQLLRPTGLVIVKLRTVVDDD